MKYYVVAKARSLRQIDHIRRNNPQIDFDAITIKDDTDTEIIIEKEQPKFHEVDGGHLSFDYVNFSQPS